MKWRVPYFDLRLGDEERRAVAAVLESNWLTTGPRIQEFEEKFGKSLDTPGVLALAVSNCTEALHLAMRIVGLGPGDEAICPSLTFVATANAIRYTGAVPVFADIVSDDEWTISPEDIERKITSRTKAIVVVHYGGYACRMDEVLDIARRHNLRVVEDVAHGPIGEWRGKRLGTIGDIGCFSFFSNKNMTTGEGGMIVTADPQHAERVKVMRSHGLTSSTYERFKGHAFAYDVTELGWNYRMDEMRAALGLVQLAKLPESDRRRREVIATYRELISELRVPVAMPFSNYSDRAGDHIFPILLPAAAERHEVMAALANAGIQTSIHYRPIHTFSDFALRQVELPITDRIAPRILSLPLFPHLPLEEVRYVVTTLATCLR